MAVLKAVIIGSQRKAEIFQHLLTAFPGFEFTGYYDPDDTNNSNAFGELIYGLELCEKADVFIVDRHVKYLDYNLFENFIRLGKHLLLDGFLINNWGVASRLRELHTESGNCVQIANTLHNRPLFTTASQFVRKPRFIKIEKHCNAPKPGEFDSWLFHALSQDLDIVFRITESGIRNITARPLFLFGKSPDLLNIHIEFDNDSICHISAGRAVETGLHKFRVFQQDRLFHMDFAENQLMEYRPMNPSDQLTILTDGENTDIHEFTEINRPIMPFDMWRMEFRNFEENIQKNLSPATGLEHLEIVTAATQSIIDKVQRKYAEV